ncbi:MAG: SDR family oxidoreductase [Chloroflexota bacterium]|nr:MAG: SDR family oxidoreductase [Chloroflexota bacterium]
MYEQLENCVNLGLRGKVVAITGGGGGIGRDCADLFAREGALVAVSDVRSDAAEAVALIARNHGVSTHAARLDVTDPVDVAAYFQTVESTLGPVDVLVNNAGIFQSRSLDELTVADWDRVMDVNLKGVFICSQAALRVMRPRRRGSIVSIASLAGQVGGIHAAANYATSKAGVISLTKSLAKHAGPFGIRVNCVNPGVIDTPMTQPWPPDVLASMARQTPLGRLGRPDEVARVIVFLASDGASFVHGAHVDINGGVHMD